MSVSEPALSITPVVDEDHVDRTFMTPVTGTETQAAPQVEYPLANEAVSELVRSTFGWLAQVVAEVATRPVRENDLAAHDQDDNSYRFSCAEITVSPRITFGKFRYDRVMSDPPL